MCQHNHHRTHRNDFFCSSLFTQKRSTHNQHQNKHSTTNIASIGMFPESEKNIYISDTSYGGYTEIDMINLFGSPAGRAINKITSIKLNKSEAAKAKVKSKDRINTNGISSSGNSSSYSQSTDVNSNGNTSATNSLHRDHTLFGEDRENSIKAISGTVGIDTTFGVGVGVGINNGTLQTIHRHCIAKPEKYMNLHKKKVKCWEFLENDKLNNNWSCTSTDENSKVDRFDELITDAEIYEEAVRFLGLSCTLSNSCRCLECQSRYFDYEDDEDYDDSEDDDDDDDDDDDEDEDDDFITVF